MRIALGVALAALWSVVGATIVKADVPQSRWSGFHLGIAAGFADVNTDVQLSASSTTTTSKTCKIIDNGHPDAIILGGFNNTCVGDQDPENPALNALFPNNSIGIVSAPFDITSATVNQLNSLTSGDSSWLGMAFVGYDQQISKSLVVGAFADVSATGADADLSLTGPVASLSGRLKFDYLGTVGGRLGWITPGGDGLFYVYGGYTYADAGNSEATVTTTAPKDTTTAKLDNFQGFSLGGGGEVQLGSGWFARLEYRYTQLNSQKFDFSHTADPLKTPDGVFAACAGPSGPVGVDCQRTLTTQTTTSGSVQIDPEIHSVRMGVGYRF